MWRCNKANKQLLKSPRSQILGKEMEILIVNISSTLTLYSCHINLYVERYGLYKMTVPKQESPPILVIVQCINDNVMRK